jgi:tRNA nucleotidyltransferase/poly(A) polymerase
MNNLNEQILINLNKEVLELIHLLLNENVRVLLLGGSVRDYFLEEKLGEDLDFEIVHTEYKKLERILKDNYEVKTQQFKVMQIKFESCSVDLAPARIEAYKDGDSFGHGDFDVEYPVGKTTEEYLKRRDFTLNAISIEFTLEAGELQTRINDPYNGLGDLENRVLRYINPHFYKDPVRFLRSIRFKNKINGTYEKSFNDSFGKFNLSKLSTYHFFKEAMKSDFFIFMAEFFELIEKYKISLNPKIQKLRFLGNIKSTMDFSNSEEVLSFLINQKVSLENISNFVDLANIKQDTFKKLSDLFKKIDSYKSFDFTKFKESIESVNFKSLLDSLQIKEMLELHQLLSRSKYELSLLKKYMDGELISLTEKLDELLPEKLKGDDIYKKLLEDFPHSVENRGKLKLYGHFKKIWTKIKD